MEKKITLELIAENLLWGLWRCISEEYKNTYKKEIWDHFENAIRSAAYTGDLKVFIGNFKKRIPIELEAQYSKDILSIINSGEDDEVLNWMREQTTYLVMLVRLKNQDRKESFKNIAE